jgi:hypothetical protein
VTTVVADSEPANVGPIATLERARFLRNESLRWRGDV